MDMRADPLTRLGIVIEQEGRTKQQNRQTPDVVKLDIGGGLSQAMRPVGELTAVTPKGAIPNLRRLDLAKASLLSTTSMDDSVS